MMLKVRVVPNAKKTEFSGLREDEWILRLNAPPVDGKANKAAAEYIARCLNLPRSAVMLTRGEKSRHKIFEIIGLEISDVARKLAESRC